jgi:CHAD domain-containing protein
VEREVARKFRVHGLFHLPDLENVPGVGDVEDLGSARLESAYFDTEDLRLVREGITLRRRTGDDAGWHLKVPDPGSDPGVRDEIRLPLSAATDVPPGELLWIVRAIIRESPVRHLATLRTDRSRLLLRSGKGKPVAELVDDTVHVLAGDGTATARFRELELEERKRGKTIDRVAAALTGAGAVGGEFVAKVVRALGPPPPPPPAGAAPRPAGPVGPRAGARPRRGRPPPRGRGARGGRPPRAPRGPGPPPPAATPPPEGPAPDPAGPDDPAAATVTAYLATQVRALRAADLAFRRDPDAAEDAVHRMRVAARRLRGGLRTFRPLLDARGTKPLEAELAWFARGLNDLRENDVLRGRLVAHSARLADEVPVEPMRAYIEASLLADGAEAKAAALRMLESETYLALHEALVAAVRDVGFTADAGAPARDVLPALVQKVWKRLSSAADALDEDTHAVEWHKVRLLAKRARYAGEAVATALGNDARAFAREMERLTELLGEHQDAYQAIHVLHRLAQGAPTDPEVVFALGALTTAEQGCAQEAQARFAGVWARARRVKAPKAWTIR